MSHLDEKLQRLSTMKRSQKAKMQTLEKLTEQIDSSPKQSKGKTHWQYPFVLASAFVVCIILLLTIFNGTDQTAAPRGTQPLEDFTTEIKLERIYYFDGFLSIDKESFKARSSSLYLDVSKNENPQQLETLSQNLGQLKEEHITRFESLYNFSDIILQAEGHREWRLKIYSNGNDELIFQDMLTNRYFVMEDGTNEFYDEFYAMIRDGRQSGLKFYFIPFLLVLSLFSHFLKKIMIKKCQLPEIPKLQRKTGDRIIKLFTNIICCITFSFFFVYYHPVNLLILLSIFTLVLFNELFFDWKFSKENHNILEQRKYKLFLSIQIVIYFLMNITLIVIVY
ncbi:hypothetical protein JFL43_10510 [Viridibacillus sp. YIM B01967]|uniref:DUF4181 domain-containing protein n=1 Tax=Viridibacillus soli TaxID=2798301 RepID=A0ABS1H7I4_9BACL|nr:hypothetical protein [Viridibacillus soli]MBK3495276.1 hypothetical protein [Viridibacillus soli]